MDQFSIGQVSKILHMPVQTIRFLEDKGLVNPARNEENNYRLYSLDDVRHLIDYRWYRDAGCSLDETVSTIVDKDLFQVSGSIRDAQMRTAREAEDKRLIAQRLDEYQGKYRMDYLASVMGTFRHVDSPEMVYCVHAISSGDEIDYRQHEALKGFFANLDGRYCFLDYLFFASEDMLVGGEEGGSVTWAFGIERRWVDALAIPFPAGSEVSASTRCLYTIIRVPADASPIGSVRSEILPRVRREGFALAGGIMGNRFATILEGDMLASYDELWIPVK